MIIPNRPGIYAIVVNEHFNKRNGNTRKMYIGCSSTNMEARIASHIWKIKDGSHPSKGMMEAFRNEADFDFVPIVAFDVGEKTKEEIGEMEKKLIYGFKTDDPRFGYNINKRSPKQALIS